MKFALLSIASAALFFAGVSAQSLTLNTPTNVIECQPLQLSWSGGTAPYFLTVHAGATPNAAPLFNFGQQNGTTFTWSAVNEGAGTSIGFTLTDSTGLLAQTAAVNVIAGTSTACLNSTATGSQGPAVSTTATSSSTPTNTSPSGTTATPNGSSSSSSSPKTSTTSTSSSKNAANPIEVSYGVAGILGMVIAAVLA